MEMINTLLYTKKLEDVGVPREQAETHVQIMTDVIQNDLAMKSDLAILRSDLRGDMAELRQEIKNDLTELRQEFKADLAELRQELKSDIAELRYEVRQMESRLMIKLGGMMAISMAITISVLTLILKA
jgi:hypothetical protein